jgi:DNA-binding NarL/FixJ family response regulator
MSGNRIIIADKHPVIRNRMVSLLTVSTHSVVTTSSTAHLMQDLLQGGQPIIVLGDGLEEGMPVATLVRLLKCCNPHATIILVADDVALEEERRVRQQGIFYRANRPRCAMGWDELQLAIACACRSVIPARVSYSAH